MSNHGHVTHDIHHQHVGEHAPSNKKVIWLTFWILLVVTIFEVAIAFTSISKEVLKYIFIGLTIVKAYFIVFNFMHLKYEVSMFKWIILLPFTLIVYLIFICLYEGNYLHLITF